MSPELTSQFTSLLHWVVGGALSIAVLFFIVQFLLPGLRVGRELRRTSANLTSMKAKGPVLDLDRLRSKAIASTALHRCWDEFRDTLHGQKQPSRQGVLEVTRWRATAAASAFFTEQTLVDSPLRTEFYKHLPGILTGIGIIGTFSGLILGLQAFGQVDLSDAERARQGLQALLRTVGGAFVVSGAAIALAMALTTVEKIVVNGLYTQVESLCGLLDSLFEAGAGEDYLQRLVEAAETSATQAMQMKESLVTDLKQVLSELTHQQIATMTTTSSQLGQSITTSLENGLKEPLARISDAVRTVSGNQGDAVNKLLTDVLSSFTSQMENMFGGQIRGMGEMLNQTANTIQQASQRFEHLIGQIERAGAGATDTMATAMTDALRRMHEGQDAANAQMRAFLDQMKRDVAMGQSESAELTLSMMKELSDSTGTLIKGLQEHFGRTQGEQMKLQLDAAEKVRTAVQQLQDAAVQGQNAANEATSKLLSDLGSGSAAMVTKLHAQSDAAENAHAERQAALAEQANSLLQQQSTQISRLTEALHSAEAAMRNTVERMKSATDSHLERFRQGADRLKAASDTLTENLGLMKSSSDGLNHVADRLNTSAGVLTTALGATQLALSDQKGVRDALAQMVSDLRTTIESAKREASITADLVDNLQMASRQLVEAQSATVGNLEEATQAIGDAHGEFARQVEATLREGNRVFHEELAQATGLLKGAIQNLGDVLDNLPTPA